MCYKCVTTNASQSSDEDCFREILTKINSDISELEERMTAFQLKEKARLTGSLGSIDAPAETTEHNRRHSLPADFIPPTSVKPPLPPGKRRPKSLSRSNSLNRRTRSFRKQFVTLLQVLQAIDESNERKRNGMKEKSAAPEKPLPFPVDYCEAEHEAQELLLMQRVTDSLKERRRVNSERRLPAPEGKETAHQRRILQYREKLSESQRKILKELDEELKNGEAERNLKIREDVIIDWENNYDNLNEPVVLEGKSLYCQRRPIRMGAQEERVPVESEKFVRFTDESDLSNDDLQTKIRENQTSDAANEIAEHGTSAWEDCLASDKISVSSMSDYEDTLTTYSDFENDLIEAINLGESWCNEKYPEEKSTSEQTVVSDLTVRPGSCLDESFAESVPDNAEEPLPAKFNAFPRKSASDTKLINMVEPLFRSKSADFFRDSLTEDRLRHSVSTSSLGSDIVDWITAMRGVIFVEDKYGTGDDREEWFTSFDPEGRLYFFDELSNESSWALPDINAEGEDGKFDLQRSATESAIPKGFGDRLTEDGEKWRHRGSSARSSKTQSMVIDPKLDFSSKDDGKTLSMPRDLTKIYGEIIRSGMLNKTKICENGKKLRKNWTQAFVVLSSTKLLFFKDAKTFHSMKPGNDCLCLNLQGAVIEKGDKISSKKNVYKVNSADHTEVLIQTDRTSDAEDWFKDILTVIQNLPQESINSSTSSLDPNSPSKVGRTKSVKAKNKDGGSMEDLSLNSEERQNKIKAKLKKFFNRRPTVDSLKKKGIWKDEPVFGCSLEQITKNRIPRVPVFVEKCIECIESKEENLKTDGLYRASGNLSQVQKIRLEVDQNNLNILKEEEDVHVLTGSLKLFFRELKDPLIPFKQLVPALTAINNPKRKEKIKEYRKIVGTLPGPNYDTLKFLLQHLLRVEKYNEFNRMNVNNLAIVFGPTLMWPEQESTNMALDFMQQNLVIECLLREFQEIFT